MVQQHKIRLGKLPTKQFVKYNENDEFSYHLFFKNNFLLLQGFLVPYINT